MHYSCHLNDLEDGSCCLQFQGKRMGLEFADRYHKKITTTQMMYSQQRISKLVFQDVTPVNC
jgi:hypothetical protein